MLYTVVGKQRPSCSISHCVDRLRNTPLCFTQTPPRVANTALFPPDNPFAHLILCPRIPFAPATGLAVSETTTLDLDTLFVEALFASWAFFAWDAFPEAWFSVVVEDTVC
jgi:hypothetical protein